MKKLPPIEKVYEAWTALADNRVEIKDKEAFVKSSDGEKEYTVRWDGDIYASDDNATYWQGYPGYPVIAVLMLQGKLPFNQKEAELWRNINWTELNKKYKNKYAEAVKEVERERNIDSEKSSENAALVMKDLESLPIIIKRKVPSKKS